VIKASLSFSKHLLVGTIMNNEKISPAEIKELLFYLNNAKLIDKLRILQADVIIIVTWALLILIAAFSETFLNISTGEDFTVFIWIVTLIFGGGITVFLKEQLYLTFRPKFKFVNIFFVLIVGSGVITAITFDYLIKLNEIIFPIFSILIAIYSYYLLLPYYEEHQEFFKKNLRLLVPLASLCSGFVNTLAAVIIEMYPDLQTTVLMGENISAFASLIFVLFLSPVMLYTAYYNHKQIRNYIEGIEISE
jgi:hypothetical protein